MENIPPNGCLDIPSPSDYKYIEVFGVGELPDKVENKRTTVYNQSKVNTPSTTYACTCYSATHCVNESNAIEAEKYAGKAREVDPVTIWSQALQRGANIKSGWSLQGASNLVKDLGCISGYTVCRSLGEVKQALANGQTIQTGSGKIDWTKTKKNKNIVVVGTCYNHAFMLEGYDDETELLTIRNSYGPESNDHGRFYLKYKDFNILFSCLAYTDSESTEIRNYQALKRRELAVQRGYYNGKDNDAVLIRQDAATMAEKVGTIRPVWNRRNKMIPVFRGEYRDMIQKASGKKILFDIGEEKGYIKRGEAAEWLTRI